MQYIVSRNIDVELKMDRERGERRIDLYMWKIPWTSLLQIDKDSIKFEPFIQAIIGMEMLMESRTSKYRIHVPCFIDTIGTCMRRASNIPGFDTPLEIEKGIYNFTLMFKWVTREKGVMRIWFNVYSRKKT
ncbi:MAG: hypothetical protein QXP02_03870 [Desulfurococcaceae archaeon]